MKVLIAGCGYLGTALGERLVRTGHEVWALRRDEETLKALAKKGFKTFPADLQIRASLRALPAFHAVVLCQAPAKNDSYEKIYYEGTRNLLVVLWRQELK